MTRYLHSVKNRIWWQASGKRVKRGLYRTAQGWLINADCNGSANIGRKVAVMLGLDLSGISFGRFVSAFKTQIVVLRIPVYL